MSSLTITDVRPTRVRGGHAPVRTATRPASRGELRLTRRGRLVVFLGALSLLLLVAFFWGAGSVATDRAGSPEPTRVVMVEEGDTLWAIASEITTDGDVRATVDRIERLNALESSMLQVGQKIRVPMGE